MLASKQISTKGHPTNPSTATQPDLDTAAHLRTAVAKLYRRLRPTNAAASAGLTPAGATVLLTVSRVGPIRLSDLAESEGLNPTMLSRLVAELAERGLAKRVNDPHDRRVALVKATPNGRRLCERMRRERTDALNVGLEALSPADRRALEQAIPVLEELAEGLKRRKS